MKKKLLLISHIFFLLCTAMSCDEARTYLVTELKDVKVFHVDNAGQEAILNGSEPIKKEAYMLCIQLLGEEVDPLAERPEYHLEVPITQLDIYTVNEFSKDYPAGSNISVCFKDYPLHLRNRIEDKTTRGGTIECLGHLYTGNIYKALMTIPQAGKYQFRVVLTLANDEVIERITEPIELN